jgi:hypothetical protein
MLNLEQSKHDWGNIYLSAIGVVDLSIIMDYMTIMAIDAIRGLVLFELQLFPQDKAHFIPCLFYSQQFLFLDCF